MNKQALEQRAESLQKELDALKAEINKPDRKGRYKPKLGDRYFYINSCGNAVQDEVENRGAYSVDTCRIKMGNCYRTREESQHAKDRQKAIVQINDWIDEENNGVVDWENYEQYKYYIYFDHQDNCLGYGRHTYIQFPMLLNYIKSDESAKKIMAKITKEQLALIGGV